MPKTKSKSAPPPSSSASMPDNAPPVPAKRNSFGVRCEGSLACRLAKTHERAGVTYCNYCGRPVTATAVSQELPPAEIPMIKEDPDEWG